MDDLSVQLQACRTGCVAGGLVLNLMYADDFVVFSPSTAGLQQLVHIFSVFGVKHDIMCNADKSVVMICRTKEDKYIVKFYCVTDDVKYLGHSSQST